MMAGLREGAIFSVPLDDGRYALGVAARRSPRTGKPLIIVGYFFGPYAVQWADSTRSGIRRADSARAILRCGLLNLHNGIWTIVGQIDPWHRDNWPLPL